MPKLHIFYDIKSTKIPIVPQVFYSDSFFDSYVPGVSKFKERCELIRNADPYTFFIVSKNSNDNMVAYRIITNDKGQIIGCGVFWINFADKQENKSPLITPILPLERMAYGISCISDDIRRKTCTVQFISRSRFTVKVMFGLPRVKCLHQINTVHGNTNCVMPICVHVFPNGIHSTGIVYGYLSPEEQINSPGAYTEIMKI